MSYYPNPSSRVPTRGQGDSFGRRRGHVSPPGKRANFGLRLPGLLNTLGKRNKMQGLPSILSLFPNEFNKFNNTRAHMLDSIYDMTLRLL